MDYFEKAKRHSFLNISVLVAMYNVLILGNLALAIFVASSANVVDGVSDLSGGGVLYVMFSFVLFLLLMFVFGRFENRLLDENKNRIFRLIYGIDYYLKLFAILLSFCIGFLVCKLNNLDEQDTGKIISACMLCCLAVLLIYDFVIYQVHKRYKNKIIIDWTAYHIAQNKVDKINHNSTNTDINITDINDIVGDSKDISSTDISKISTNNSNSHTTQTTIQSTNIDKQAKKHLLLNFIFSIILTISSYSKLYGSYYWLGFAIFLSFGVCYCYFQILFLIRTNMFKTSLVMFLSLSIIALISGFVLQYFIDDTILGAWTCIGFYVAFYIINIPVFAKNRHVARQIVASR